MSERASDASRPSIFDHTKRSCTDWPCLVIFIALLIVYVLFAIFVFREGSLSRFINPTDSQGRLCGVDSQVGRPYVQFFDMIQCIKYALIGARCPSPQICVKQCPSTFYHYKLLYAQELKLVTPNREQIRQIRGKLSCDQSAQSQVNDPAISIYSLVKQRKLCAPYAFPSMTFYGRCIPSVIVRALNATIQQADDIINHQGGQTSDDDVVPGKDVMQTSLEYFKKLLQIKRLLSYMFEDLVHSRYILLLSMAFALAILLVYMLLLRYIARLVIWLSLILCIVVFALAAAFCFTARARVTKHARQRHANSNLINLPEMNVVFDVNQSTVVTSTAVDKFDTAMILLDEFAPMSVVWLVLGIACCTICAVLMICTCCLRDRIRLAAALIGEASKAICHALTTLLWPLVTFVSNIAIVTLGVLVLAHYFTLGRPIYQISCAQDLGRSCRNQSSRAVLLANESQPFVLRARPKTCFDCHEGDSCTPEDFVQLNCSSDRIRCVYVSYGFADGTFERYLDAAWSHRLAQFLTRHPWLVHIFNIFMIYWLLALVLALEEMVLACTFASYYWESRQMDERCCSGYCHKCLCLQGVFVTLRFHLGTIVFGSSILAIIDTLRTVTDLLKDRLEAVNLDVYGKCCFRFINVTLGCVRCCFQFFSRYTYIMTAVSGKWFCTSAFSATRLLLENCLRAFVLDRVCAIVLYIGRVTVTIGACVFTALLLDREELPSNLHFSWFPVLLVGVGVYVTSAIFLHVYATGTSTLFFCVLYDFELHGELRLGSSRLKAIVNKSSDFRHGNDRPASDTGQSRF